MIIDSMIQLFIYVASINVLQISLNLKESTFINFVINRGSGVAKKFS